MAHLPSFLNPVWERSINGDTFTNIDAYDNWADSMSNSAISQNHPILTPALLFVSKLFSQAEFGIKNKRSGKKSKNHWILKLLENPNAYQTKLDFLETLMFSMISNGAGVVYKKRITGFKEPNALYILDYSKIKWPSGLKSKYSSITGIDEFFKNQEVEYDDDGEIRKFLIKDLIFFYDLPNCLNKNPFEVKSRIDGLKQTLVNTQDSLIAKNIILKSNGKELLTLNKDSMQLSPEEKEDAEQLINVNYGLSKTRKRGLITKASLTWKSLHIALRDLGLDESTKVDGNIIFTALHIPKDILSLEAKKTTYNNFKESMVSYIQNEMQSSLKAVISTFQKEMGDDKYELYGDYDHLPVMQFIMMQRYEVVSKRAKALNDLLRTGIPQELALEMTGFESTLELGEIQSLISENNGNTQQQTDSQGEGTNEEEDKSEREANFLSRVN